MGKKTKKYREWYDIKTKVKQLTRALCYSYVSRELICLILYCYMYLVFITSKKIWINKEVLLDAAKERKPLLVLFWHNRLFMIPFIAKEIKKNCKQYNFMTLASKHGDGRFVGRVMEKFGLISIYGSTKDGRKASRGIDFSSMKQIISGLKNGFSIGLTPDGPRGPNQQINGNILDIAKATKAGILPISYSSSRFIEFRSWDSFKLPLPFSKICFYIDENIIHFPISTNKEEVDMINQQLKSQLDSVQESSFDISFK